MDRTAVTERIFVRRLSLTRFFRESNLEMLETIVRRDPASLSETARLVDRDYREVHRNLTELESLGIVEFDGEGKGTPKRPIVPYDSIDLSISFTEGAGKPGTANP